MAIKKPIPISFGLDSHNSVQSVCAVIHIDDKNTETLDLSLMQSGEHIAVSPNSTVTARFVRVKDKILISDNVACTVQENGNILIPIDNAAAHMLVGEIKIEVNIVDENDVLTMQFPLVIRVNNTILADAEISPESEGTIPELLEEAREAAEDAAQAAEAATEAISTKQDKLTAGENITIEDNVISAEGGGVTSYNGLTDKPQINGVTLSGNKTTSDLNIETGTDDYEELDNLPKINGVKLFGDKYHHQLKLFGCLPVQNEVERLETVLDLKDSKNAISSVAISRKGYFPLSMNPRYRKIIVSDYQNPNGDGLVDILFWQDDDSKQAKMAFRVSPTGKYDYNISSWRELTGSQIVSGVVNANGTITFTDSEDNSFTTSGESVIGADEFSPSATVQQTASGATITVTDKNGTTTANISNGQDGNDYVLTAQDKDDIANIVLNELPTTQGVLYGNQSN